MPLLDWIIVVVLAVYLLVTLAYHLDPGDWVIRKLDYFSLVPKWTFFAPQPATRNLFLLYRDEYPDGNLGSWAVLYGMEHYRSSWSFIWNPAKRLRKTLFDLLVTLLSESGATEENRAKIKMSISYLLILNHIAGFSRSNDAVATQFLVMENDADGPSRSVFTSELHAL